MGFVESVKDMLGFGDYDYEDEEFEMEEEEEEVSKPRESIFSRKSSSKVVSLESGQNQSKIVVLKPKCFNNASQIADELRRRRPVIVDVGALDPDEARRIIDFVSGTVYGIQGRMEKITSGIFVATPSQVDIMGEVLKDASGIHYTAF
ncbi:MAG: cell division protein SepF [Clostridia bacterium]|nr:cell division protein SepF [Clostridia bacterium]